MIKRPYEFTFKKCNQTMCISADTKTKYLERLRDFVSCASDDLCVRVWAEIERVEGKK